MQAQLGKYADSIYGLMRIVVGFLFACHGAQKIFGLFGGVPPEVPAYVVGGAGTIELVGGLLVMIGLFTSWAAFICSGTMAAAYFTAHQPQALFPIQNQGELAAVYAFVFLYIASRGGVRFAVQAEG